MYFPFTSVMDTLKDDNCRKYFFGYIQKLIALHLSSFQPVNLLMGMCLSAVCRFLKLHSKVIVSLCFLLSGGSKYALEIFLY